MKKQNSFYLQKPNSVFQSSAGGFYSAPQPDHSAVGNRIKTHLKINTHGGGGGLVKCKSVTTFTA